MEITGLQVDKYYSGQPLPALPRQCRRIPRLHLPALPGRSALAGTGLSSVRSAAERRGPAVRKVPTATTAVQSGDSTAALQFPGRQSHTGIQAPAPPDLGPAAGPAAATGDYPPLPGPATAAAGCGDSAAAAPQPPGAPGLQPGDGTGPAHRPRPGYSAGLSQSAAPTRHPCPAGPRCPRPTAQPARRFHLPSPGA